MSFKIYAVKKVMTLMNKTSFGSILLFVVFYMWAALIKHGDFTPNSNVKGSATDKLSQLHNIRHSRLIEPHDSPNYMEDVCNQIPETLDDENLEAIGLSPRLIPRLLHNVY